MYYFYILKSKLDNKYYYGSARNLKKRFDDHKNGRVQSTVYRRPLVLVYYEAYVSHELAVAREMQVKTSGSVRKNLNNRIS